MARVTIDTIGKYIGKNTNIKYLKDTDNTEDKNENLSNDPEKYHKMYEVLEETCKKSKDLKKRIQIIVVDNDYPGIKYEDKIIKKFSVNGNKEKGYEIGFINDAKPY